MLRKAGSPGLVRRRGQQEVEGQGGGAWGDVGGGRTWMQGWARRRRKWRRGGGMTGAVQETRRWVVRRMCPVQAMVAWIAAVRMGVLSKVQPIKG